MDRRKFIKTTGATALSANILPFLKFSTAEAAPAGTAVVVIGQTLNSLDLYRKGTNRPSYQIAERYAAIEAFMETNEADLHPVTREITVKVRNFSATDTFQAIYKLADLKRRCGLLIEGLDMLCVPTAPTWCTVSENLADPIGTHSDESGRGHPPAWPTARKSC